MAAVPLITIFVRHSKSCPYAGDETSKRCRCPKHLRWSSEGKQYRRSAKSTSWTDAETAKRKIEAGYEQVGKPEADKKENRPKSIDEARKLFLMDRRGQGLNEVVLKKYSRELLRFQTFMGTNDKYLVSQITGEDCTTYRGTWNKIYKYKSSTTRTNVQGRLISFLKFCYDNT